MVGFMMILALAAVVIVVCGTALLLGVFLAVCAVARDADELTREHLARRARETREQTAVFGCDGPEVMSRSMRRRYREVGCGR
jgi:hypothetical protein